MQEKSPWCRAVVSSLFILGWPCSKMSLIGNKFAAACARGPVEEMEGWGDHQEGGAAALICWFSPKLCSSPPSMAGWVKDSDRHRGWFPESSGKTWRVLQQCGRMPKWFCHHSSVGVTASSHFPGERRTTPTQHLQFHSFIFPSHFHPHYFPIALQEWNLFSNKKKNIKPLEMVMYKQERPPFNRQEKH